MKSFDWKCACISVLFAELTGVLANILSGNIPAVYQIIRTPPLSPPGWVFGPVWTVLYALMGLAAYFVWQAHAEAGKDALRWYAAQLLVNFLWPVVFFRYCRFWIAGGMILVLIVLIVVTMRKFRAVTLKAGCLMLPYLLWVLFAAYLNFGVAFLNR